MEKVYSQAFDLYANEKYEESKTLIEDALVKYPKDGLVPKFALLSAFNSGKIAGKEIMILQLEQIALNYAKTREGEKAAEMLKYLQSDLQIEKTDENGNKVVPVPQNPTKIEEPSGPGKPMMNEEIRNDPPKNESKINEQKAEEIRMNEEKASAKEQ